MWKGDADAAAERDVKHTIFASMRFVGGKPLPEAVKLREELEKQKVFLKIVELNAGADINQEVFESIEQAGAFMVFGPPPTARRRPTRRAYPHPPCTLIADCLLNPLSPTAARTSRASTPATPARR